MAFSYDDLVKSHLDCTDGLWKKFDMLGADRPFYTTINYRLT